MKTSYLSILAILLLTGCAEHVHKMVKEDSIPLTGGELLHDRGKDNFLVIETPQRRYEARGFAVERDTNLAELRKRYYGVNPKHWERIFSGLDTAHTVSSLETTAKSADGHEITCSLAWKSGTKPEGVCTDQTGAQFPVSFE